MTEQEIRDILAKDSLKAGIRAYQSLMGRVHQVNVAEDRDFQRDFNHFYRMRQRPAEYYRFYFRLMEECKDTGVAFRDALRRIHEETGRCEASFASKLAATVNPKMPIWDSYVLQYLGLKAPGSSAKDRLQRVEGVYCDICRWYLAALATKEGRTMQLLFEETFPDVKISKLKKLDFILWQYRQPDDRRSAPHT